MAGFGGQGIVLAGRLLAQTAMRAGLEVTYMPSYGAEVRGGTANCMVIVSSKPIACPVVSTPNSLVICNKASLSKFAPRLRPGGQLIFNSSLIEKVHSVPEGVEVVGVPAEEIAIESGSPKSANMVMLGAYLARKPIAQVQTILDVLREVLPQRRHHLIGLNEQAIRRGQELAAPAPAASKTPARATGRR